MKTDLGKLFRRMDLEGQNAISTAELAMLGIDAEALPFMMPTHQPDAISCMGCHEACIKPVQRQNLKHYILCDELADLGYIEVTPQDMRHLALDLGALSHWLAELLNARHQEVIANRVYDLGVRDGKTLFLVQGATWQGIDALLADSRICNQNPLLITLSPMPTHIAFSNIWLGQLLAYDANGQIAVDLDRLYMSLGSPMPKGNSFYQRGKSWHICYEGKEIIMPDSKGLAYIQHLLLHPHEDVAAITLQTLRNKPLDTANGVASLPRTSRDETLDEQTIAQITQRLSKLPFDSPERIGLQSYLYRSVHKGKAKSFLDANEKARQAVKQAINRVVKAIGNDYQPLATHLSNAIKHGKIYHYKPEKSIRWQ